MDPVNPEFTITVLEARIKLLSSELEQMTKHANEGWALANTRTAQWKSTELQNDELRDSLSEILQALRNRDSEKMYTEEIEDAEKLLSKIRAAEKAENRRAYTEKPKCEECVGPQGTKRCAGVPGCDCTCHAEKRVDGLQIGESRNLPYPKPISNDDAIKRKCDRCLRPMDNHIEGCVNAGPYDVPE